MRIAQEGRWLTWLASLGFLVLAGCSNSPPAPVSQQAKDTKAAVQPPADAVQVKLVKYDGLQEAIKQLKGKVVVVDVWADW